MALVHKAIVRQNKETVEEKAIIDHTFDLDAWGFPPTKNILQGMANKLATKSQHFKRQ